MGLGNHTGSPQFSRSFMLELRVGNLKSAPAGGAELLLRDVNTCYRLYGIFTGLSGWSGDHTVI